MARISKIAITLLIGASLSAVAQEQAAPQSGSQDVKTTETSPAKAQQTQAAPSANPCPTNSQDQGKPPCITPAPKKNPKTKSKSTAQTKPSAQSSTPTQSKPATQPSTDPSKRVVRDGGTSEPSIQLAPEVSEEQASEQSQTTIQLLASTDENLKIASGRSLSAEQQDTIKQVKNYVNQARAATTDGDVQRAYNLAVKANLLSVDLVNH
jgi:hypothetical protein